jgi:hypothetical protein
MWVNVDGIGRSVAGDNGLRGLAETAGEAALVGEGADVVGAERAGGEGAGHAVGDVGLAVADDEAVEFSDLAVEVDSPASNLLEVKAALGREAC